MTAVIANADSDCANLALRENLGSKNTQVGSDATSRDYRFWLVGIVSSHLSLVTSLAHHADSRQHIKTAA